MRRLDAEPVRVALLGSEGRSATSYKGALLERAPTPVKVFAFDTRYTTNPQLKEKATASGLIVVGSQREALEEADIAAIVTPDGERQPALDAINTPRIGIVIVEKPLATSVEMSEKIAAAAEQQNKLVLVGTGYRATFKPLVDLIQDGAIGEPQSIYTDYKHPMQDVLAADSKTYGTDSPWRVRQDPHWGAIHALDTAIYAAGPVSSIKADESQRDVIPRYQYPGSVDMNVLFENGMTGEVVIDLASPLAKGKKHGTEFVVKGTKGTISAHNKENTYTLHRKGHDPEEGNLELPWTVDLLVHNALAIQRGERSDHEPFADARNALVTVYTVEAAQLSAKTGKREEVDNRR
jgi:predicted dehydrogenase